MSADSHYIHDSCVVAVVVEGEHCGTCGGRLLVAVWTSRDERLFLSFLPLILGVATFDVTNMFLSSSRGFDTSQVNCVT